MDKREAHINFLFSAELQFRLASAVRIATTLKHQPFDLPMEWIHGSHRVRYEEIALRQDQGEIAAAVLHHTVTFTMAVAIKDAIEAIVPKLSTAVRKQKIEDSIRTAIENVDEKVWTCSNDDVINAYHIARLIRNAFAHAPFAPKWMIQDGLRNKLFIIPDVIQLDTQNLHDTQFDWVQYGGPIAMFRYCRFVRLKVLRHEVEPRKEVPIPANKIIQQGNLITIKKVDESHLGARVLSPDQFPDGKIPLGGGHFVVHRETEEKENEEE